ncbi:MAG: NADH:ubiquinone reductase (Na(+)-transporting) subunit F [Desulfobacterales bacterium]|nr:NADH:ubiquinone reductase (Na(+)-transporting) subunit F [Desulfobacterales bacterium]
MSELIFAVGMFTLIVLMLVSVIMFAKAKLLPSGDVKMVINQEKELTTQPGGKLLGSLADQGIFVPSACGGGGTCGQCLVKVHEGGGDILPTELAHITKREAREGERLACQVSVKQDLLVEVPPEVFETKKWMCKVRSNDSVADFIKELVLELPEGEAVDFKAGGYIQIEVPPHELKFTEFDIPEKFRPEWDKRNLWQLTSTVMEPCTRAYSMASYPGEKGIIMLNVRIALPPAPGIPTGVASTFIFNLKPGDEVEISGPYGEFFINETDAEMVYIGRGAGMAPLRSHIFELLKGRDSQRRISYWYNARNLGECFYLDEFAQLAEEHENFSFHLALSRPASQDNWTGLTGYVHQVLHDSYLAEHPAPEDIEYYMCGPPVMSQSVVHMLDNLGVEYDNINFDDFGA